MNASNTSPPVIGILDPPPGYLPVLLEALAACGLRCGLIQLADADFDPDIPGKDSFELRKAGVNPLLLAAEQKTALLREYPPTPPTLGYCLAQLALAELDLVLVAQPPEGWLAPPQLIQTHRDGATVETTPHFLATLASQAVDGALPLEDPAAVASFIHTTVIPSGDKSS